MHRSNNNNKMSRSKGNERHQNGDQVQENQFFFELYKRLYLDADSADVHFICDKLDGDGESERVPAHKLLLSMCDGFKKLFADADTDQNEYKLDDTPSAALKEFLQFFYTPKIKLTFENIAIVMKLATDFGNKDFLICCSRFLEQKLTTENIIWGYGLAIRFDRDRMKSFCEQKISAAAADVLKSNSFFECDRSVLGHLLQLDTLKCDESLVLAACLAWAKASAERKELDGRNTQVLREELADLLYDIRFKSMTIDSFSMIIASYGGFFSGTEFEEIIQMIVSKDYQSDKFNSNLRNTNAPNASSASNASNVPNGGAPDDKFKGEIIDINRYAATVQVRYYIQQIELTRFEVNKPITLIGFTCSKVFSMNGDMKAIVSAQMSISEESAVGKTKIYESVITLTSDDEGHVPLCCPIPLVPNKRYEIAIEQPPNTEYFNQIELKTKLELKNGIKLRFLSEPNKGYDNAKFGLVHRLQFKRT